MSPGFRHLAIILQFPCAALLADDGVTAAPAGVKVAGGTTFEGRVVPFLATYCTGCHGGEKKKADLGLDEYRDEASVTRDREVWEKVHKMLLRHEMPPAKKPQPSEVERSAVVGWIQETLSKIDCSGQVDPGRVTIHRLNRAEYRNTVRDLVGIDFAPAGEFPADEVGYGFDNMGDVLSISALHVERYVDAADAIIEKAAGGEHDTLFRKRFRAEDAEPTAQVSTVESGAVSLNKEGEIFVVCEFPEEGEYVFRSSAYGQQAGPEPPRMAFRVDGRDMKTVDVTAEGAPVIHEARVTIPSGKRRISVAYLNNYVNMNDPDPAKRGDRNLVVDWFEVERPRALGHTPETYRRIFTTRPGPGKSAQEAAREILGSFAPRAYRRPLKPGELDRLLSVVTRAMSAGDSFEDGVRLALKILLSSPHFLFRVEVDPEPGNPLAVHALSDFEVASRLSYFLWSSMPDDELLRAAAEGRLHEEAVLEAQTRRMLVDPRSRALADNFAAQWLQTRFLDSVSPDPGLFPGFDAALKKDMETETLLFFEAILEEDRSILDFIDADFTFLDERLAKHYGIEGVKGTDFRRVPLSGGPRGGVLTQGSVLTITSNPTRTSPVKRGRWILEQVLGEPPPPPPPNVPALSEAKEETAGSTLRQRMEVHRANPNCAVCHTRMDAMGFAFENFDAVGAWREFDGKLPVDSAGKLPDGSTFDGPEGLKAVLKEGKAGFARALAEKLMTYALGRGIERHDRCALDKVVEFLAANDYRLKSLILGIVKTEPFLMRRGGAVER